jgi:hypothetical protein
MLVQRLTHPHGASDVALLPGVVERLFVAIVAFESWLGEHGIRLPFGGSILTTAVKP